MTEAESPESEDAIRDSDTRKGDIKRGSSLRGIRALKGDEKNYLACFDEPSYVSSFF